MWPRRSRAVHPPGPPEFYARRLARDRPDRPIRGEFRSAPNARDERARPGLPAPDRRRSRKPHECILFDDRRTLEGRSWSAPGDRDAILAWNRVVLSARAPCSRGHPGHNDVEGLGLAAWRPAAPACRRPEGRYATREPGFPGRNDDLVPMPEGNVRR